MPRAFLVALGIALLLLAPGCATSVVGGMLEGSREDSLDLVYSVDGTRISVSCRDETAEVRGLDRALTVRARVLDREDGLTGWVLGPPTGRPRDEADARLRALAPSELVVPEPEGPQDVLVRSGDAWRREPLVHCRSRRWSFVRQLAGSALLFPAIIIDVVLAPIEGVAAVVWLMAGTHRALP